ncbi:hypothetical protein [Ignavibacterium sp.]|uniref:hypothetical protein n=1 Tax=Ignavibacterium sp. TaxID=2651167 RepID=UPI0026074D7D|nr:hypothetical protein [Ignavibacterium sp.]
MIDKWILTLPVIGPSDSQNINRSFLSCFLCLVYSGSAESIEPIRIAAEAAGNRYFEDRIKNVAIPLMIKKGVGVTEAFEASGVFTETALSRFHSGEETGTIKNTALQLSKLL